MHGYANPQQDGSEQTSILGAACDFGNGSALVVMSPLCFVDTFTFTSLEKFIEVHKRTCKSDIDYTLWVIVRRMS